MALGIEVVEDEALDLNSCVIEPLDGLLEFLDRVLAGAGDDQRGADVTADDRGVGDGEHRRRVDDDRVEARAEFGEQHLKARMHQQFGGVGGNLAGRYDPEVGDRSRFDDFSERGTVGDVFRSAGVAREPELLVDVAATQIRVDDDNAFVSLRQHSAKVFRDETLAQAGAGAGDEQ